MITARHIVTSQSRQRFVFNSKVETKQTRLTEFEMIIKKEVATLKESLT